MSSKVVALDVRTATQTGIHRVASEISAVLCRDHDDLRFLILGTATQRSLLQYLSAFGSHVSTSVVRDEYIARCDANMRQLVNASVNAYFSFSYTYDQHLTVPCAFSLYDLTRFSVPALLTDSAIPLHLRAPEQRRMRHEMPIDESTVGDILPVYFPWKLRACLRNSAATVVPSDSTKNRLVEAFGTRFKLTVNHPGVTNSFLHNDLSEVRNKHVLIVGRGAEHKRRSWMLDELKRYAQARDIALGVVIVGDRLPEGTIPSLMPTLRIIDLGMVADEELARLYRRCSALVVGSADEGWHLPSAEAAASGLPVVAPDALVFQENIGTFDGYKRYVEGDCTSFGLALDRALALPHGVRPSKGRPWTEAALTVRIIVDEMLAARKAS